MSTERGQPQGSTSTTWLGLNAVILITAAFMIESVPVALRRPVAAEWLLVAILLNVIIAPVPTALARFVPLFFLKLLVFHQIPEAPLAEALRRP